MSTCCWRPIAPLLPAGISTIVSCAGNRWQSHVRSSHSNTQTYVGKLTEMIDGAKINTLTVLVMEVPCCRGLVQIARQAREKARRHIPVKTVVLSAGGEVIDDQWI